MRLFFWNLVPGKNYLPEEFQFCFLSDKGRTVIYLISLFPWMLNHNSVNPHSWPIWFLFLPLALIFFVCLD